MSPLLSYSPSSVPMEIPSPSLIALQSLKPPFDPDGIGSPPSPPPGSLIERTERSPPLLTLRLISSDIRPTLGRLEKGERRRKEWRGGLTGTNGGKIEEEEERKVNNSPKKLQTHYSIHSEGLCILLAKTQLPKHQTYEHCWQIPRQRISKTRARD